MFSYARSGWSGSPAPGATEAQVDLLALGDVTSEEETNSVDQRTETQSVAKEQKHDPPKKAVEAETDSIDIKLAHAHLLLKKHHDRKSPVANHAESPREASSGSAQKMDPKLHLQGQEAAPSPQGPAKTTTAAKRKGESTAVVHNQRALHSVRHERLQGVLAVLKVPYKLMVVRNSKQAF
jgi:hypothetical protein